MLNRHRHHPSIHAGAALHLAAARRTTRHGRRRGLRRHRGKTAQLLLHMGALTGRAMGRILRPHQQFSCRATILANKTKKRHDLQLHSIHHQNRVLILPQAPHSGNAPASRQPTQGSMPHQQAGPAQAPRYPPTGSPAQGPGRPPQQQASCAKRQPPAMLRLRSGAVAQMGERCVRNAEVRGSIPLGSTIFKPNKHRALRHVNSTVLFPCVGLRGQAARVPSPR